MVSGFIMSKDSTYRILDGENFRVEPVITRAFLRDVVDPVDALELVLVEPESRRTSAATTAAGTTATGNAEEGAARGKKNTKVDIQWRRPDFLVMVRFFSREGWTRGTLSFNLDSKQPILLVELKIDVYCHVYDEKDFAPRRNVFEEIRKAVPQVLLQAQFAFSEYPALEKIHALIAVGTFCCDFSVSRARLPSLKETGLLFEPAKKGGPKTNAEDFLGYAEGMSKVYHIMNRDGTDFSTGFKRAWAAARSIHSQLKSY